MARTKRRIGRKNGARKRLRARRVRIIWLAGIVGLLSAVTMLVSASRRVGVSINQPARATTDLRAVRATGVPVDQSQYVSPGRLWPQLQHALIALGDRLEKPGKERVFYGGMLIRVLNGQAITSSARVLEEFPDRVRIEQAVGSQVVVTGFNGVSGWTAGGSAGGPDQDLIETLVYDSAEHFFLGQSRGFATRLLGGRFTSDASREETPGQAVHDIYSVGDQIGAGPGTRRQGKLYYLNSDNQMLEKIRYTANRGGTVVEVEVRLSDWKTIDGQRLPGAIARYEDGKQVISFSISTATIGPKAADNAFDRP